MHKTESAQAKLDAILSSVTSKQDDNELNSFNSKRHRRRSDLGSSAPRTYLHFLNGADAVQNFLLTLSSSTVDNYYILGGQHLAYAVVAFRDFAIGEDVDLDLEDVEEVDRKNT